MRHILHIEDDPTLQRAFSRILREHKVVAVKSGEEAMEYIAQNPSLDAIISDYDLDGDMTGGDVLAFIKNKHPELEKRFVFVSGNHAIETHTNHLFKPCLPVELRDMVESVME